MEIKEKSTTKDKVIISLFYRFIDETKNVLDAIILLSLFLKAKKEDNTLISILQQTDLAKKLHINTGTIRKHFKRLKQLGFIETKPTLQEVDYEDFDEIFTYKEIHTKVTLLQPMKEIIIDEIQKIMK